jgi:hypothetical protein
LPQQPEVGKLTLEIVVIAPPAEPDRNQRDQQQERRQPESQVARHDDLLILTKTPRGATGDDCARNTALRKAQSRRDR